MAFSTLKAFMSRHPLLMNAVALSSLYAGADISQQTIRGEKTYDKEAPARNALIAAGFFAPVYHVWYRALDKNLPGRAAKTVVKKILLDQGILGAIGAFVFFAANGVLEGKKGSVVLQETKERWPKAYFIGWVYWPIMQGINFVFLPTALRTVYVGTAAFIWTNFLCYLRATKTHIEKDEIVQLKEVECSSTK